MTHGETVYLGGQVPDDGSTGLADQPTAVLVNIDRRLELAGSSKEHLLSVQIWLQDIGDFAEMNEVWLSWIDGVSPPARATGEVKLADDAWRVEMIVTAAIPG